MSEAEQSTIGERVASRSPRRAALLVLVGVLLTDAPLVAFTIRDGGFNTALHGEAHAAAHGDAIMECFWFVLGCGMALLAFLFAEERRDG